MGIQSIGDRIIVSDVQESIHFVKYRGKELGKVPQLRPLRRLVDLKWFYDKSHGVRLPSWKIVVFIANVQIVDFDVNLSSHWSHEFLLFFFVLTLLLSIARILLTFDEGLESFSGQCGFLILLFESEFVLEDVEGVCRVVGWIRLVRLPIVVYFRIVIRFIPLWVRRCHFLITILS